MTREQFVAAWDLFQERYLLWWVYGLGVIEVIDVVLKWCNIPVSLVSQTAKRIAFSGMTAFAFFFASMTFHWFVTWKRAPWTGATEVGFAIFFWAVFVAYMFASWFDPTPKYWPTITQWLRYPPVAALIGAGLAWLCFPQKSNWFPGLIK